MHVLPLSGDRGDTQQALVLFLDGGEMQSENEDAFSKSKKIRDRTK